MKDILFYFFTSLGCILFVIFLIKACYLIDKQTDAKRHEKPPKVILDAGHGGEDGGAVSKSGIVEKDVNLAIVMTLKEMFNISGFEVIMIREKDISINDETADTIREKKVSDLHNRLRIANSVEDGILLSVHQNNFTDSKYWGAQVFFSNNNPMSKELSEYIRQSFSGLLQPQNTREIKPAGRNIYILWNAKIPAVIVECGFLSNSAESEKLNNEDYQKQIAFTIYCGFMNYFKSL